jgi:hypothetical protein
MAAGDSAKDVARKRREKAERLARSADAWERGAAGEQETAQALAVLSGHWEVVHDLRWPGRARANIDHVIIGPGGVFVVDTKNWSGSITMHEGVLRQNGYNREAAVRGASEAAQAIRRRLPKGSREPTPVLCFVGQERFRGRCGTVLVCGPDDLVRMLETRPPVLTPDEVRRYSSALRRPPAIRGTVGRARPRTWSTPLRRPRKAGGRRLLRLVPMLLFVGVVLLHPEAIPQLSEAFANWFTGFATRG